MNVLPVTSFLRILKGKRGIKVQLFFDKEITWVFWMEAYSPLKVWAGSRVGFQCHPLLCPHSTLYLQSSHNPGSHFGLYVLFGFSLKLSRLTMSLTTINEGPKHATQQENFNNMSTPFSKVIDLWERIDPVWFLFTDDTELSCIGWACLSSEEMAKVYAFYVGLVTGKAPCCFIIESVFTFSFKQMAGL